MEAGSEFGIRPCGLGARNTLRLEAGMSLYGHEISEEINVFEGGLDRWLKLDKGEFIGREALLAVQAVEAPRARSSALKWWTVELGAMGTQCMIFEGARIGTITSGSPAPFLKTNIAFALVPTAVAASGADVIVQCRANQVRAKQVPISFNKLEDMTLGTGAFGRCRRIVARRLDLGHRRDPVPLQAAWRSGSLACGADRSGRAA